MKKFGTGKGQIDRRKESEIKFDRIAERVYNASFVLTVFLILGASIGTAIVRYLTGTQIELVPDNVFKFIKDVLYIFAVPVSIKIIGDKLPLVVQALDAWRSPFGSAQGSGYGGSAPIANQTYQFGGYGQTGQYPTVESEANPNTYY